MMSSFSIWFRGQLSCPEKIMLQWQAPEQSGIDVITLCVSDRMMQLLMFASLAMSSFSIWFRGQLSCPEKIMLQWRAPEQSGIDVITLCVSDRMMQLLMFASLAMSSFSIWFTGQLSPVPRRLCFSGGLLNSRE